MRISLVLPAALVMLGAVGPAFASSCGEQIATIERRLDSTGAEKVTGIEPAGGATSSNSPKALDKTPNVKPTDPTTTATAGGISEARDLIKTARAQDKAGDETGCNDTMTKVKQKAGALP
ncbi:hypothetical protein G3T14_18470 [Methylobacterium sp. BTF04]|uniref:hypothetical protein n=1 Tax=Methylobacterium sp. BTF04 TaxID=2708300 RepID=UPI0013D7CC20|nr:hypothetical protein [Methylobacterium sp. BTF04]NEU14098.1 hypothetical protein [Methylobacterium sp. BTF04]